MSVLRRILKMVKVFSWQEIVKIILPSIILLVLIFLSIGYNIKIIYNVNSMYLQYIKDNDPDILVLYNGYIMRDIPRDLPRVYSFLEISYILNRSCVSFNFSIDNNDSVVMGPLLIKYRSGKVFFPINKRVIAIVTRDSGVEVPRRASAYFGCFGDPVVYNYSVVKVNFDDLSILNRNSLDFIKFNNKYFIIVYTFPVANSSDKTKLVNGSLVVGSLSWFLLGNRYYLKDYIRFFEDLGYNSSRFNVRFWYEPYWVTVLLFDEMRFTYSLNLASYFVIFIISYFIVFKIYYRYSYPIVRERLLLLESLGLDSIYISLFLVIYALIVLSAMYILFNEWLQVVMLNLTGSEARLTVAFLCISGSLVVSPILHTLYRMSRGVEG